MCGHVGQIFYLRYMIKTPEAWAKFSIYEALTKIPENATQYVYMINYTYRMSTNV